MKVTEKLSLQQYFDDERFRGRSDNHAEDAARTDRFALISDDFFYFGASAVPIPLEFQTLEKKGPGFRDKFDEPFITKFDQWIRKFPLGLHCEPRGKQQSNVSAGAHSTSNCGYEPRSKKRRCGDRQ
jgi:hypothetical protein